MPQNIKVAVLGAAGRMGRRVCQAVDGATDMELVARLSSSDNIADLRGRADVAVDFTVPAAAERNVAALIDAGIHAVVGTTGWDVQSRGRIAQQLCQADDIGVIIAPNFSLAAVLVMRFAAQAARYFDSAEVIELHHPNKL